MVYRLIILLACLVFFINSCNSLISLQFGTHKLRTFTMEEVLTKGVGDTDYIKITDAWTSGDYYHVPGKHEKDGGLILYPILSKEQVTQLEQGQKVNPYFVGWTQTFPWECLEQENCVKKESLTISGVVRELKEEDQQLHQLPQGFDFASKAPVYLEVGRQPTAWYWHLLLLLGSALMAFSLEYFRNRKEKKQLAHE